MSSSPSDPPQTPAPGPELVRALLERERLLLAGRFLPGVVHNLSGGVQTMSLPLDLARLALKQGDASKLANKLDTLREGLERLTEEVGLLAGAAALTASWRPSPWTWPIWPRGSWISGGGTCSSSTR